jgi:hypothetical protein
MRMHHRTLSRPAAAAAALVGAGAALFVALPSRGQPAARTQQAARIQQTQATVQISAPASVSRAPTTDVSLEFTLPAGVQLPRSPRLRVVDEKEELYELLPTYLVPGTPARTGHRGLHTENYRPGTYRVRAKLDVRLPDGKESTAVSPWATLTVP